MSANKRQVGGNHYANNGGLQHWDVVAQLNLDYFQGQITKYVIRWKDKGGIADLEKAKHFLEKYIELNSEETTEFQHKILSVEVQNEEAAFRMQFDGAYLDGTRRYRCYDCKETIGASNPQTARALHGNCAENVGMEASNRYVSQ